MEIVTKMVECKINKHSETSLTLNKKYNVIGEEDNKYLIKNDKNEIKTYYKSRFK